MSEIKVNKVSPATGTAFTLGDSGDTFTFPAGATVVNSGTATGFGGGKINQIVQTTKADVYSQTANSWTDITDVTVDITPTATDSKILVLASLCTSKETGGGNGSFRLVRDSTVIGAGTAGTSYNGFGMTDQGVDGNTMSSQNVQIVDSPATTSATTYKCQCNNITTSHSTYINRRAGGTTYGGFSSITVMEILA